ncbi:MULTISPECIES: hypothetical protein [unclassified Cupriavidus]|uniref:hypothetical protein n=1 Tax=unclassified Cupriavidus TaxID=2640874 RepID=UPI001CEE063A|nr:MULTISPECIES: hypothetical protein [unclassified Cupriavidus]
MLNTLPLQPAARSPRAIVKVAGVIVPAWIRWTVENNTFYQADTFRVEFAANALPDETNAKWFSEQQEAFVEIFAGFPADPNNFSETDLDSLIYGRIDDIDYDPVDAKITVSGRDLTAAFIDRKTTIQYQNLTSSEIAAKLAVSHGMSVAGPATKTKAGSIYAYDRVSLTDQRSEWDLLTWLAAQEGFQCYVNGRTLHFEPRAEVEVMASTFDREAVQKEFDQTKAAYDSELNKSIALYEKAAAAARARTAAQDAGDAVASAAAQKEGLDALAQADQVQADANAKYLARYKDMKKQLAGPDPTPDSPNIYELRWEIDERGHPHANVKDLRMSRSLTVAKGVTVVVRSWNAKQAKAFTASYPSKAKSIQAGKASPFGDTQIYSITRGGLDQDSALKLAQKIHKEITQHEMKLRAVLPADNILKQTSMVRLTGTGTAFDQDYFIDGLARSMSVDSGYEMTISAKNTNPETVPSI